MDSMIFQMFSDSPEGNLNEEQFSIRWLIIIRPCMNCVSFPLFIYLLVF